MSRCPEVVHPHREEELVTRCRIPDCPGTYEVRRIIHAERHGEQIVVIDDVPAEVCDFCGDTLFGPDTVEMLEQITVALPAPAGVVPLYRYPHPMTPTSAVTGAGDLSYEGKATG